MKCACGEKVEQILSCNRCYHSYCDSCNPYFDSEQGICQTCQEREQITSMSEDRFTAKLRLWFTKPAIGVTEDKQLLLPWEAVGSSLVDSAGNTVCKFNDFKKMMHCLDAANRHHHLHNSLVTVYNRIRKGQAWFDGTEDDVKLWQQVRDLLQ